MTQEQSFRQQFDNDGFVILRNLVSLEDIFRLEAELTLIRKDPKILDRRNLRARYKLKPAEGVQILDALDPLVDISRVTHEIATSSCLEKVLMELYGESPRLFKDKVIFKDPGSPGYPWHQDFISWPFFPRSFLTAMIAIDESTPENGCLEVIRGSHKKGYLSKMDGDFHDLPDGSTPGLERVEVLLAPGDVVIFGAFTVHGSGANRTNQPRKQLYLSYNRESDGGDQRASHYRFFHSWLRKRYEEYGTKESYFY